MGLASRLGLAWRLASVGLGPALGVWSALGLGLWRRLALLVDPMGLPSLRLGLTPGDLRSSRCAQACIFAMSASEISTLAVTF